MRNVRNGQDEHQERIVDLLGDSCWSIHLSTPIGIDLCDVAGSRTEVNRLRTCSASLNVNLKLRFLCFRFLPTQRGRSEGNGDHVKLGKQTRVFDSSRLQLALCALWLYKPSKAKVAVLASEGGTRSAGANRQISQRGGAFDHCGGRRDLFVLQFQVGNGNKDRMNTAARAG